jgi:signal transduction histidine kinase
MTESHPGRLLIGAGALVWAVAVAAAVASWVVGHAVWEGRSLACCAAYATFGVAFGLATATEWLRARERVVALFVQSASALVIMALGPTGLEGALLCVVAGEAPLVMGGGAALGWVVAQTAAMFTLSLVAWGNRRGAYLSTAAYGAFQLFAFGAARLAASEAAARQEVTRVHAELLATQELFADSTRTAERLRIARELHDALGHRLTALSLQLELARNVAEDRSKEPVGQAHALTKELFGELRTAVGAMREDQPIDLSRALRTLVAGIPRPHVHLDVPDNLRIEPALAHTIFRCVQEALTNALRHAHAENVFLVVEQRDETITVVARDDGRGAASVQAGHGLTGLRERVEGMGGRVEVDSRLGYGVTLRALLPLRGGAA